MSYFFLFRSQQQQRWKKELRSKALEFKYFCHCTLTVFFLFFDFDNNVCLCFDRQHKAPLNISVFGNEPISWVLSTSQSYVCQITWKTSLRLKFSDNLEFFFQNVINIFLRFWYTEMNFQTLAMMCWHQVKQNLLLIVFTIFAFDKRDCSIDQTLSTFVRCKRR
jgi:hypothetical protein